MGHPSNQDHTSLLACVVLGRGGTSWALHDVSCARALGGRSALVLWMAVLFMGAWTGAARARRFPWAGKYAWAYATMFPLASVLTVQAVLRALVSRRIEWRGRIYEMRSPSETVIVR